jgi:hypothetical protein
MRKTTNFKRSMAPTPELTVSIDTDKSLKPDRDDASEAFQTQIDNQRQAERIQREAAAQAPMAMTLREKKFLSDNPDFLHDHNREVAVKAMTLANGHNHAHDSEEYHSSVQHYYNSLKSPAVEPAPKTKPKKPEHDFEDWDEPSERATITNVSAPPSREVPSASYPDRPGRITLSVEQLDMAKRLGQTPVEYAKGLMEMRERDKVYGR